MARTAAAKKVAKAASTGAAGKGFKLNRNLLFPGAMLLVVVLGIVLVLMARGQRSDNVFAGNQDWYSTYDFYECDSYLGVGYPATDPEADLPIEAQADRLIHVQPFHGNVTDATGTIGGFTAAVGVQFGDDAIELPDGRVLTEAAAACASPDGEGDPGAELRVLRWNSVDSPASVSFVEDLAQVRLNDNGQVVAFAMVHPDVDSTDIGLPDTGELRALLGLESAPLTDTDGGGGDDGGAAGSGDGGTDGGDTDSGDGDTDGGDTDSGDGGTDGGGIDTDGDADGGDGDTDGGGTDGGDTDEFEGPQPGGS